VEEPVSVRLLPGHRPRRFRGGEHLLFVGPAVFLLLAIVIFPLVYTFVASLYNWDLGQMLDFVGIGNYLNQFRDHNFWLAMFVTLQMTVLSVGLEFAIGLGLAILVNRELRALQPVIRTALLIPLFTAPVVVGSTFRMLLDPQFGVLQYVFNIRGFAPTATDPFALLTVVAGDVWQWTPFMFIIFLAALQGVPRETIEAARVDGASGWQQTRFVLLPQIAYAIVVALLLRLMDALKIFDVIVTLTRGGPGRSTEDATFSIYRLGLENFYTGDAAAFSWVLVVILSVLVGILFRQIHGRFKLV
jgi:multiple sugar transport system permease protein